MTLSPRNYKEALTYARGEHDHESRSWAGYCQMFVRTSYGIPSGFGSAWAQWLGADAEDKHAGGSPHDAPLGAALLYKGSSPYGHIMLAANDFPNDDCGAWSNDLVTTGKIDKVVREAPVTHWGQKYLGYLTAVNDYDLQLKVAKPAKPKQDKRYKSLALAIDRIEDALLIAKKQKDKRDIEVLTKEVARLKRMYENRRHA